MKKIDFGEILLPDGADEECIGLLTISIGKNRDVIEIPLAPDKDFVQLDEENSEYVLSLKNMDGIMIRAKSYQTSAEARRDAKKIVKFVYNECYIKTNPKYKYPADIELETILKSKTV